MGADGRIYIWNKEKLDASWPSAGDMLETLGRACYVTPYTHTLDGVEYVHLYSATGLSSWEDYAQDDEWSTPAPRTEAETVAFLKMREFVRWLKANATIWEVWT